MDVPLCVWRPLRHHVDVSVQLHCAGAIRGAQTIPFGPHGVKVAQKSWRLAGNDLFDFKLRAESPGWKLIVHVCEDYTHTRFLCSTLIYLRVVRQSLNFSVQLRIWCSNHNRKCCACSTNWLFLRWYQGQDFFPSQSRGSQSTWGAGSSRSAQITGLHHTYLQS